MGRKASPAEEKPGQTYGCTLMNTGGDKAPSAFRITGTAPSAVPDGSAASSCTLICVTPATRPGAEPLHTVVPAKPAKVTCGLASAVRMCGFTAEEWGSIVHR